MYRMCIICDLLKSSQLCLIDIQFKSRSYFYILTLLHTFCIMINLILMLYFDH